MVWNLFPFKGGFSFVKSQKLLGIKSGVQGANSRGWFHVLPKNSAQDVMHEQARCHDEATNHQLPMAVAFWIIWIVSVEECSSFTQNFMQFCCSTCSVILNAMATQYTCSLSGVYRPHCLLQWSRHCSCMSLSLAARLHQCFTNCSHYINNGCAFSGQTSCIWCMCVDKGVCGVGVEGQYRFLTYELLVAGKWIIQCRMLI